MGPIQMTSCTPSVADRLKRAGIRLDALLNRNLGQ